MTNLPGKSILATFLHTPKLGQLEFLERGLVSLDAAGRISAVIRSDQDGYDIAVREARSENSLIEIPDSQYVAPGFVDLHVHEPQWPQLGKALDVPLEVWLQDYTFPLEARYADAVFAERMYVDLVRSLLSNGTTTAVYFGTIHQRANRILADICLALGQRAVIGKVAMDDPAQCPDYYRDADARASVSAPKSSSSMFNPSPGTKTKEFCQRSLQGSYQVAVTMHWTGWGG